MIHDWPKLPDEFTWQTTHNVAIDAEGKEIAGTARTLTFGGEVYRTVRAKELWERLMRSTYDCAEPGVICP